MGMKKDARKAVEKSLELDYHTFPASEREEEDISRTVVARCRKLQLLGECCGKGEESVSLFVWELISGCICLDSGSFESLSRVPFING